MGLLKNSRIGRKLKFKKKMEPKKPKLNRAKKRPIQSIPPGLIPSNQTVKDLGDRRPIQSFPPPSRQTVKDLGDRFGILRGIQSPNDYLGLGSQRDLDDAKEMLGDKFGEYEAAMNALGSPIMRPGGKWRGSKPTFHYTPEQEAQRRAIQAQFLGDGQKNLNEYQTGRENKTIDDKIAQYGSYDAYERQQTESQRKEQMRALIQSGNIEEAIAMENQFKEEDAKKETQRTQLNDFRTRYGIEAPTPVDDRERFRQSVRFPTIPGGIGGKELLRRSLSDQSNLPHSRFESLRSMLAPRQAPQPAPQQEIFQQLKDLEAQQKAPQQAQQQTQQQAQQERAQQERAQHRAPQQAPQQAPQMKPQLNQMQGQESEEEKKRKLAGLNSDIM